MPNSDDDSVVIDDDNGVKAEATSLLEPEDETEDAVRIVCMGKTLIVSLEAKQAMGVAIDASSNRPTIFYRMDYVVKAACKTLSQDYLEHLMPQDAETMDDFDWSVVIVGFKSTYPKRTDPTDEEYAKVRSLYNLEKEEKDAQARKLGQPKSSVQSYITFKQRWRQMRSLFAVYRYMQPTTPLQQVYDYVVFRVKLKPSIDKIYEEAVNEDLHKFLKRRNSGDRKNQRQQEIQKDLDKAKADKLKAAAEAQKQEAAIEKAKQDLADLKNVPFEGTKRQAASARKAARTELRHAAKVAKASAKENKIREKALEKEEKQLAKLKEVVQDEPAANEEAQDPPKKKLKRNDTGLLDMAINPRKKVELEGDGWKPPTRKEDTTSIDFDPPGAKWKATSLEKLNLLLSIGRDLQAEGLMAQRVMFTNLMEHIDGTADLDFNARVFLFVVGLIVHRLSTFEGMVQVLQHLERNDMLTPAAVIEENEKEDSDTLETIIGNIDDDAKGSAVTILNVCQELVKAPYNGVVPSTADGLTAIGLTEEVSVPLMQRVFGCTGLHCGLHLRKLVVALDLIDWESAGVSSKLDIKMTKVPAAHVQRSLLTWIPQGERLVMFDTLEELAFVVGSSKKGFWGSYEKLSKKHVAKDKTLLINMATDIHRFYKAVKGGGKGKR